MKKEVKKGKRRCSICGAIIGENEDCCDESDEYRDNEDAEENYIDSFEDYLDEEN